MTVVKGNQLWWRQFRNRFQHLEEMRRMGLSLGDYP